MPKLITGPTGCGKNYHALTQYEGSYAYIAPCKQLVYEMFQDYGNKDTHLKTGDVYLPGAENFMGTYEALRVEDINDYDRIIIDESHYLDDRERGGHILDIINACKAQQKEVLLLTATQNLSDEILIDLNVEHIELKAWKKTPEKKEVDFTRYLENIVNGHPSIYFCKYTPDISIKETFMERLGLEDHEVAILSASNTGIERITVQNDFREGKIRLLICTNVLAQGLNFPTTNLAIEYNERDGREVIEQKLGRLGRPNFCDDIAEVYYCLHHRPGKHKVKELIHEVREPTNISDLAPHPLETLYMPHMMIKGNKLYSGYGGYKYCYPSLKELVETENWYTEFASDISGAYQFLLEDRAALQEYLLRLHAEKTTTNQ